MIRVFSVVLLAGIMVSSGLLMSDDSVKEKSKGSPETVFDGYETKKVAAHTYVIHGPLEMPNPKNQGFMNNPGFVVTNTGVVVVDPGSSVHIGRALVKRIKEVTDKPITHAFSTHVHGDHWLGNQALKEANPDIKLYAHPMMILEARAGKAEDWISIMSGLSEGATDGSVAVIPVVPLTDKEEIKVGGITFRISLSKAAHTHTDAMIVVVEDKLLFTGDNLTWQRMPRMDDGSFRGSIATLRKAMTFDVDVVVPGHGMTGGKDILNPYHDYLDIVYAESARLLEDGLDDFEMKDEIREKVGEFKDWAGFDTELGKHISISVLEAEQAAFE